MTLKTSLSEPVPAPPSDRGQWAKPWPVLLMVRELNLGGCERDLTKIALGLDRTLFEPHVGCFHPEGFRMAELQAGGVPVVRFPVTSFGSLSAFTAASQLGDYMRRHRIRLFHAYDSPTVAWGVMAARFQGAPVVLSSQLSYRGLNANRLTQQLIRWSDRLVDRVVVNCEAMRRHLVDDEGLKTEKTYLCYNGVETEVFYPPATSERERRPELEGASVVIGSVCALRREKRLDLILEAYARVKGLRPGVKVVMVGSGVEREGLEQQAERLGIRSDVVFVPAQQDVASWLRSMDIFVLASESEAFSNALLEALACGCAPIGSSVGGTPEQIVDGERGFIFPSQDVAALADKLKRLILDDGLRKSFGLRSAEFARTELSMGRACERMGGLYRSLIEQAASRAA